MNNIIWLLTTFSIWKVLELTVFVDTSCPSSVRLSFHTFPTDTKGLQSLSFSTSEDVWNNNSKIDSMANQNESISRFNIPRKAKT